FGNISEDTVGSAGSTCPAAVAAITGNASTECVTNAALFNPFQNNMPDFIATQRWDQPWGHIQVGEALREITINDGKALDMNYLGYGAYLSGDFRPFYTQQAPWAKDDLGWGIGAGSGIGSLISDCL